ncbi:MAG: (2Fe-2S)-binding protein [FCB group bacterium]|nr:(2Fe-2S)-binding protein [FCB group bacterium]
MLSVSNTDYFDLELTVNGTPVRRRIPTHLRLLDFLREELGLTGTKEVCGEGECGACTVLLDGLTVDACLIFAVETHGMEITTIEGLSRNGNLTPLQQAFIDHHSVQCGFCIPGMILSGEQMLRDHEQLTREEIRQDLSGNICRCTGYQKIVDAIESVSRDRR